MVIDLDGTKRLSLNKSVEHEAADKHVDIIDF